MAKDMLEEQRLAAAGLFHDPVGDFAEFEVCAYRMRYARQFALGIEGCDERRERVERHGWT